MCVCVRVTGVCPRMSIVLLHSSPNGRTNERPGGGPIPSRSLFFSFFFLFAMLMRDELACISRRRCRRRPSVRPSVSPRHEAGSFLSSLTSVHVGGAQVAHPTGGGPWTYSLPNEHIYKKKRKYGSLCLDAHKFRTPLVLRYMVLLHSTHTTRLHYTRRYNLLLLTYYGDKDAVCFKSRMFVFSAVPCSYPRHTVYLTTIMPPCKEEGRRQARQQYCILHTLLY